MNITKARNTYTGYKNIERKKFRCSLILRTQAFQVFMCIE